MYTHCIFGWNYHACFWIPACTVCALMGYRQCMFTCAYNLGGPGCSSDAGRSQWAAPRGVAWTLMAGRLEETSWLHPVCQHLKEQTQTKVVKHLTQAGQHVLGWNMCPLAVGHQTNSLAFQGLLEILVVCKTRFQQLPDFVPLSPIFFVIFVDKI